MRDRFGIFGTVTRIRKLSTFGNDVKNTQQEAKEDDRHCPLHADVERIPDPIPHGVLR